MPHTIEFLSSPAAASLRAMRSPPWIVWVELSDGQFYELDADNQYHARNLAAHWYNNMPNVVAVSYRQVFYTGATGSGYYDIGDDWEEAWDTDLYQTA